MSILDELKQRRASKTDFELVALLSIGWCEEPPGSGRWLNVVSGWVASVEPEGDQYLVEIWHRSKPDIVEHAGELPPANAGMLWADSVLSALLKGA